MEMESTARAKASRYLTVTATICLTVFVLGSSGNAGSRQVALVVDVTDGDTISAEWGGSPRDIRLIGVDTPETVHPTEPVQCFGPEASAFTDRQLAGERVRLEFDIERFDRYDRTLAYVWKDGSLYNRTLVRRGYARVSIYPPNDKFESLLRRAERLARQQDRGLWDECAGDGSGGGGGGGGGNDACHPSYPDFCITPPPPDLDCVDVNGSNFTVVGSDPHGFDGNNDGVGCET